MRMTMTRTLSVLVAAALGLAVSRTARAELVTLTATRDNTIYEEGEASNGAGVSLFVGTTGQGNARRALVAFDVGGSVPAGSTVRSVSLTMAMSKTRAGSETVALHRLLRNWGEGSSNAGGEEGQGAAASSGDATWTHAIFDSTAWAKSGGDFAAAPSASVSVGGPGSYTWTSTPAMVADVQGWVDSPGTNSGWTLIADESRSSTAKRFGSRESGAATSRPRLTIDFAPVSAETPTPTSTATPTASPTGGGPLADPIPATIAPGPVVVRLETVATGLAAPNWGTVAPGQAGRLFVADQNGLLWAVDLATGHKTVFLDVTARLVALGIAGPGSYDERGLLGVAFHPNYAVNGLLYTYTSEPVAGVADFSTMPSEATANHQSVVVEWRVSEPTNPASTVAADSARELFRVDEPQFNHNGGHLAFGPDGLLYVSLGDGGAADDEGIGHGTNGNGQNPGNVLGTLLRLDPTGSNSANGRYGIPPDNPFVGVDGFVEEIFAYGFRNPFRFSFDALTNALYVADVGQNDIEEIDVVTRGGNYGWPIMEGSFFFDGNGAGAGFVTDVDPGGTESLIRPIAQYDHDEGKAIIGGFVYWGSAVPDLVGSYVFGDFARTFVHDGRLFHLDESQQVRELQLVGRQGLGMFLLGFGRDAEGELYVLGNQTGTPFGDTGVVLRIGLAGTPCAAGDCDRDGRVTVDELVTAVHIALGQIDPGTCTNVDVDQDGTVTVDELVAAVHSALAGCPTS